MASGIAALGAGPVARLAAQSSDIKAQLVTLTAQSVDGRRGTWLGDFAGSAGRAISLRAEMTRRDTHATTIGRALGTTGAAQDALEQLSALAERFLGEAGKITVADSTRITALAAGARQAVMQVAGLLNERHGDTYLFGGADTANPPIPDPGGIMDTPMATGIASAVATLAPGNSAAVLAATRSAATATAPGDTPFSDYALDPAAGATEARPGVLTGEGETVATGLFASRDATTPVPGSATGGWSRDLLRGLMTLAALQPGQTAAGSDFDAVMTSVKADLRTAMTGLGNEAGALGQSEARLEAARTRHEEMGLTLRSQLSDVEEVDLAATLTAMQDTQTRLQASWQALSMLSGLSLAKFMG